MIGSGKLMSGDATLTDSSVSIGGNWTSGVTKLTNSTATVTSLNAHDTTLGTNSIVQISANSSTNKLNVLGGSQFKIGAGAKLTTTDATVSGAGSKATVGDGSTLQSTTITLTAGSAIVAGTGSTVSTTAALSATDSSVTFGTGGTLTAATTSLTNSALTMGDTPTASLGVVVMTKGSSISLGVGGSATLADLTMTDSSFGVGNGTTTTVQNVGLTINLSSSTPGSPTAGTDYDQVQLTGTIDLGGATLSGAFGTGVQFGDRFTIVTAPGGVTGKFAEPFGAGVVFIQGQKFQVDYSDPTKVVLQKIRADVTVTVVSSANPSTFGQLVTFTVTVTPEPGAALIPTTTNVTFTLDGTPQSPVVSVNASSQAVYSVLLAGGTHTIRATFNGDPLNFNTQTSTTLDSDRRSADDRPAHRGPDVHRA